MTSKNQRNLAQRHMQGGGHVLQKVAVYLCSCEHFHQLTEVSTTWTRFIYASKTYWQHCHRALLPSVKSLPLSLSTSTRGEFLQLIRMLRNSLCSVRPVLPPLPFRREIAWPNQRGVITFNVDILMKNKPIISYTNAVFVGKDGELIEDYSQVPPWTGRKSILNEKGTNTILKLNNINSDERNNDLFYMWSCEISDFDESCSSHPTLVNADTDPVNPAWLDLTRSLDYTIKNANPNLQKVPNVGPNFPIHCIMSFHIEMEGGPNEKEKARKTAATRKPVILLNERKPFFGSTEIEHCDGQDGDLQLTWRTDVDHHWATRTLPGLCCTNNSYNHNHVTSTHEFFTETADLSSLMATDQQARYGRGMLQFDPEFDLRIQHNQEEPSEKFNVNGRMTFCKGEDSLDQNAFNVEYNSSAPFEWKNNVLQGLLLLWDAQHNTGTM
jgi:hypothetical protein